MTYFLPGLWHLAAAMSFAVSFGILARGEPLFWLKQPIFDLPLVLCSSALFFVPEWWAKQGLLKFLHYPLPDWDVLLLGPASHRHWLSHAPFWPLILLGAAWNWPILAQDASFVTFALGTCVGVGSHLFWDCVGSQRHKIVVVPHWFALREVASRLYLLLGALICLSLGWAFAFAPALGL